MKSICMVAVVAVGGERFCAALFVERQVAVTFFDGALYGKVVHAARNGARDIPVFGFQVDRRADVHPFECDVPAVGIEMQAFGKGERGNRYVLVGGRPPKS